MSNLPSEEKREGELSLETPLLNPGTNVINGVGVDKCNKRSDIVGEIKKQLWLAGPLTCVCFLQFSWQVISIMFVGHLGELALASASLGTSFASVTGFSLMTGMGSALDTLCGQSYGAKQYHMLGIHLQRGMFVLLLVCIPVACIWCNTAHILISLGQDPDISEGAGVYAHYLIPAIFAFGLLQCLNKFLQAQNIVFPMMIISGITTLLHFLVCWLLVFKSGLGHRGAALANGISYWTCVLLMALYVKFSAACKSTWTGFSREALHNILDFLRLGIPSGFMVCIEFWSFEAMVLMSGLLLDPQLETSTLSIILNTCCWTFNISFGLSSTASTRVSNELGAGRPQAARLAVHSVLLIATVDGTLLGLAMILLRDCWGYLFSNEERVVRHVADIIPLLAVSIFLDGYQCALTGIIRGSGKQKTAVYINIGAYYLIGIPTAIIFAFIFHTGARGLWLGIVCALFVQVLSFLILTICTNWNKEAAKAMDRVHESEVSVDRTA
ncbi:protein DETOXIFICATION 16-like [Macadamia integrifolia]|uniref:protein DETOXIFICATION 16-like n=1 Tax=Macadamia integrifolia TaxID=60698 RepID=UPI001C4EB675|nr:protein DETOXIFICATION 16-like [Macadamia integrifolia]